MGGDEDNGENKQLRETIVRVKALVPYQRIHRAVSVNCSADTETSPGGRS